MIACFGPIREISKRPDDKRVMLELAALFMSNWGLDRNAEKGSGDSQSQVVFDDKGKGGIQYNQDGNIIDVFFDEIVDDAIDGRHGWETRGRRDWGEEAVSWLDRAVRKETLLTPLRKLRERALSREHSSKLLLPEL